jgi:hypothetical protein
MTKLVSLFVFLIAFVWTWTLFNSKDAISIDIHAGIQSKLALLIQDSIKAKRPNSSNFSLQKLYTEKLDDNKIKAYFAYRYSDTLEEKENVEQAMSGEAILSRGLSEDPKVQKWVIQSVKTSVNNLAFQEGLVITSDGKSTTLNSGEEKSSDEAADEAPAEKKQTH